MATAEEAFGFDFGFLTVTVTFGFGFGLTVVDVEDELMPLRLTLERAEEMVLARRVSRASFEGRGGMVVEGIVVEGMVAEGVGSIWYRL